MVSDMESILFWHSQAKGYFFMIYLFLLLVHWYFVCIYIRARESDSLEAELQAIVCCHVGAEN